MSRSSKRSRARLPVTAHLVADGEKSFICRTRDISDHGLLLETPEVLPQGTELSLSLLDQETGQALELDAVVARTVPGSGMVPATVGVHLHHAPPAWTALVHRVQRRQEGHITAERPAKRLRVLVVADDIARRGAVALYVTSGWDVRFASDLRSTEEALAGVRIDAVIAEHDLEDGRWCDVLEAAQRTQPHAKRIIRSSLHGKLPPSPGKPGDLVHRVVDLNAGLEAVLDALAADWGRHPPCWRRSPS